MMSGRRIGRGNSRLLVSRVALAITCCAGTALADLQTELPDCVTGLDNGSLKIDRAIPAGEKWGYIASRYTTLSQLGGDYPDTCAELNWVAMKGASNLKVTMDGTPDRPRANAWDCSHSTLAWGLFAKKTNGKWAYSGGGELMGQWTNGVCTYANAGSYWGSNTVTNQISSSSGEYRVGWYLWQHDSVAQGHTADYCSDSVSCFFPVGIALSNTLSPRRRDFAFWGGSNYEFSVLDWGILRTRQWGISGDRPLGLDFNGDSSSDWVVYRPSEGKWYIGYSSDLTGTSVQWGASTDVPLVADTDGDARHDIVVYRPSNGYWYTIQTNSWTWTGYQWGASEDIPLGGDYTADGRADMVVWRPSSRTFYLKDVATGATSSRQWGATGDKPVVGDFEGDRKSDFALWRPSDGRWYIVSSSSGSTSSRQWGANGDVPMPGDYDGDGRTDPAVYRASEKRWYFWGSKDNKGWYQAWGLTGQTPVAMNLDL